MNSEFIPCPTCGSDSQPLTESDFSQTLGGQVALLEKRATELEKCVRDLLPFAWALSQQLGATPGNKDAVKRAEAILKRITQRKAEK